MKIFVICNKSPYPAKEGGPIAMDSMIQGLINDGHQVKVLAINTNKYNIPIGDIPENYKKNTGIELAYIDLSIKPIAAFLNLFTNKSYHVERFISKGFEQKIIEILKQEDFDIIQFETLYITPYIESIRKHSNAKIILRAHNIEHLIWQRVASQTRNPIKKFYLKHLAKTLKKYEINALSQFDGIASITKKDATYFKKHTHTPVIDISFGIDLHGFPAQKKDFEFPSLFHIGAMNWIPNLEGINWFLKNAWPAIHKEFPELKFYLAGREMPKQLSTANYPNVEIVGEVESATTFIQSKGIMIVPLLSGSGIRIKIIEGMTLGKAIISTAIGAEGINFENGKNIMIADDPKTFNDAVRKCLQDFKFTQDLGQNARKLIEEDHDNQKIMKRLVSFYRKKL
jgi:glycosyltransferase involved in cell wall biosynthesis